MATTDTMPPVAQRLANAAAARDEGIAQAEYAADPRIIEAVDAKIAEANASGEIWSANTIRDRLPVTHAGLVGGRVRAAMMRRHNGLPEMVWVGEEPSLLKSTHKKPIARWQGFEAYAKAHPDIYEQLTAATA